MIIAHFDISCKKGDSKWKKEPLSRADVGKAGGLFSKTDLNLASLAIVVLAGKNKHLFSLVASTRILFPAAAIARKLDCLHATHAPIFLDSKNKQLSLGTSQNRTLNVFIKRKEINNPVFFFAFFAVHNNVRADKISYYQ